MSSDGHSNLPNNQQHSVQGESFTPPPGPRSGSLGDTEIVKAIRLLQLSTPPINSVEFAETTSILANPQPLTPLDRNADGHCLVAGTASRTMAPDG